jgi:hypothetical protein
LSAIVPPDTSTRWSSVFHAAYAAERTLSNVVLAGTSASRLRRAPSLSTNEMPARIVTVCPGANFSQ